MKYFIVLLMLFVTSAFAADEPAYWMKSYPNADQAKVQKCLVVANEAYAKNLKGGMAGVAWATLHQGLAWEKCMDGK